MRSKILVLIAVAVMGVSSTAMARGGGGGGKSGGGMAMHGHGHFDHHFHFNRNFVHNFRFRNPVFLSGWGWGDWGLGGYGDSGYGSNTTVVVAFPQATPQAANVTGSVDPAPCNWKPQEFTVPSSAGGARPVQVVSCH
jgi:hypothetical protein